MGDDGQAGLRPKVVGIAKGEDNWTVLFTRFGSTFEDDRVDRSLGGGLGVRVVLSVESDDGPDA